MNDPVVDRIIRIEEEMRYSNMDRAAATAIVDSQLAEEEAFAKAYLGLMQASARLWGSAAKTAAE